MPFGLRTRVGPVNHVLDGGPDPDPPMRMDPSEIMYLTPHEQRMRLVFAPARQNTLHAAWGGDVVLC